MSKIEERYHRR